jgi:hypothetical protein
LFPSAGQYVGVPGDETKQSGGKLLPYSDLRKGGIVSRGNIQHEALQQEGLQRKEEGTSQIQDLSVECKKLESRRQIWKCEKGNAEERGFSEVR